MPEHIMATYSQLPVSFARGEGSWLWDTEGNKYLDALSGIAVCGLGHAHAAVTQALCQQAGTLVHTSNLYHIQLQDTLAKELVRLSSMDKVFFCNSGTEAVEAAIKLARLYGHNTGHTPPQIIVTENSFHGRTMGALSATGNTKIHNGFEPLLPGFVRVPYNDIEAIKKVAENNPNIVAILLEPIQGEGGINIPDDDYLQNIRILCDEHDWLMMLDEIQTSMCRTGQWFAYQHSNIMPDVVTLAKGLANGVPVGACLARDKAAEVFQPGSHGSTFGGNPLACACALAVIKTLESDKLESAAVKMGQYILSELKQSLVDNSCVKEIRGKGLMIGIELDRPCSELMKTALKHNLLISVQSEKVIRLLPALTITKNEADLIISKITSVIKTMEQ